LLFAVDRGNYTVIRTAGNVGDRSTVTLTDAGSLTPAE
jgi:hypothetical protein